MAAVLNARVTVYAAIPPTRNMPPQGMRPIVGSGPDEWKRSLQPRMDALFVTELAGLNGARVVDYGDPALRIGMFVEEHDIDLVMMPTRGQGRFASLGASWRVMHAVLPISDWATLESERVLQESVRASAASARSTSRSAACAPTTSASSSARPVRSSAFEWRWVMRAAARHVRHRRVRTAALAHVRALFQAARGFGIGADDTCASAVLRRDRGVSATISIITTAAAGGTTIAATNKSVNTLNMTRSCG